MRKLSCLRCSAEMVFAGMDTLQFGKLSILLNIPHYSGKKMELEIYTCPNCGKTEFFAPEPPEPETQETGIPQCRCPSCGKKHDFDYPKCPYCGYKAER